MKNSKIAINGFFGRMGQAIYELSLEQKFNVTLGVDKKDKLQSDLDLKLSDNLSKYSEHSIESIPSSEIKLFKMLLSLTHTIGFFCLSIVSAIFTMASIIWHRLHYPKIISYFTTVTRISSIQS